MTNNLRPGERPDDLQLGGLELIRILQNSVLEWMQYFSLILQK